MDRAAFDQKRPMRLPDLLTHAVTLRSLAGGFGMVLRVLNNGQHWEFKREGFIVDWWPSSGSLMINKQGGRRTRVFTIENLRRILERGPNQTISKRELRRWAVEASR